jgi:glycosyltransferase involved in cell wall biosynthesis
MKLALFANTDWYLYNFRRSFALELKQRGHDVLLLSPPGEYGEKLRALGLRWEPVPMDRRSLNPAREALLLLHLWRLMRRERLSLLHGFTIKCAVYGSLAARLARVPARVNSVAGLGYVFISDNPKARMLRPIVRTLLRSALSGSGTRLVLQNNDDVALFAQAGLGDSATTRLIRGSGVDCVRFSGIARVHNGEPRVLLAARMLWDKGIGEFVEAARMLRAQGYRLRFQLAGNPDPGNPAAIPSGALRDWANEGIVEWLGHVDDMPALYAGVDIVVLPSYREGLPKSLIEAAACGLPLVATDVPGCREVITDGEDGLLVPVRDATALAAAIARLATDPEFAARLGLAAKKKAYAEFDERIVIERTLAVYRELLGDSV